MEDSKPLKNLSTADITLSEALKKALTLEAQLDIVIDRVAHENDILAQKDDDDDARISSRRLTGLKQLADLLVRRAEIVKGTGPEVDHSKVAQASTRIILAQMMAALKEANISDEQLTSTMVNIRAKLDDWGSIEQEILKNAKSNS